ncbi:hypothetical protein F4806DRAFT_497567 [Annulohypoxylon nitens]|nr:hypothetical protein F4806DRAFT_497567 [Annulohypoxylon nitens]
MDSPSFLKSVVNRLDGFEFESIDELCLAPNSVLKPLLQVNTGGRDITLDEYCDILANRIKLAFVNYVQHEDAYRRFRGDKPFYYLMLANWNPEHPGAPLSPSRIEELMKLWIAARRRYMARHSVHARMDASTDDSPAPNLAAVVDKAIWIIDQVDRTLPTRAARGLTPPANLKKPPLWPPGHFSHMDVAIMAETTVRKQLFGVDIRNPIREMDWPRYPHDQDPPLVVRKFLCWLSLTLTKASSKTSLFLAPVAFITHEERVEWYKLTGHKSRFYATADEFLNYAVAEFQKLGGATKQHVMGLLTPWFYEPDEVIADAKQKDRAIPLSWEKGCFRAGMVLRIEKLGKVDTFHTFRLVLFMPRAPYHQGARQSADRQRQQNMWVDEVFRKAQAKFDVRGGWAYGQAPPHDYPTERNVRPDSVELSSKVIETSMRDPSSFPSTEEQFEDAGYLRLTAYTGTWQTESVNEE